MFADLGEGREKNPFYFASITILGIIGGLSDAIRDIFLQFRSFAVLPPPYK